MLCPSYFRLVSITCISYRCKATHAANVSGYSWLRALVLVSMTSASNFPASCHRPWCCMLMRGFLRWPRCLDVLAKHPHSLHDLHKQLLRFLQSPLIPKCRCEVMHVGQGRGMFFTECFFVISMTCTCSSSAFFLHPCTLYVIARLAMPVKLA